MKWQGLAHGPSPEEMAAKAELDAEAHARLKLLEVAALLEWPRELVYSAFQREQIGTDRFAWERCTARWTPAKVARAASRLHFEAVRTGRSSGPT